jgi:DNA-binding SARP family transcriptional activator
VAAALWPDVSDRRATANLRTTLWRLLSIAGWPVVVAQDDLLQLSPAVAVDLHECGELLRNVRLGTSVRRDVLAMFSSELVPEHYEDWIIFARERHRQFRVHALEELCRVAAERGQFDAAIEAGLLAVECEPLRETSCAALMCAHLAEGNVIEAVRQLKIYRDSLSEAGLVDVSTRTLDELIATAGRAAVH